MGEGKASKWRAWWSCSGRPNLFTVPGDPAAGLVLAWFLREPAEYDVPFPLAGLGLSAAASLLLYCAGLLAKRLFRPGGRPPRTAGAAVAQRRVSPRTAIVAAGALALAGVAAAALASPYLPYSTAIVAAVLAAAIFLYDAGGKKVPVWGH